MFPAQLSADWSFSCVPLVESISDPRNAASAALYAGLAAILLSNLSFGATLSKTSQTSAASSRPLRYQAFVLSGLLVSFICQGAAANEMIESFQLFGGPMLSAQSSHLLLVCKSCPHKSLRDDACRDCTAQLVKHIKAIMHCKHLINIYSLRWRIFDPCCKADSVVLLFTAHFYICRLVLFFQLQTCFSMWAPSLAKGSFIFHL